MMEKNQDDFDFFSPVIAPQYIGSYRKLVHYLVLETGDNRSWYFKEKVQEIFPIMARPFTHKITILKIFRKRRSDKQYFMIKIYDSTFDYIHPKILKPYTMWVEKTVPQTSLIKSLLE